MQTNCLGEPIANASELYFARAQAHRRVFLTLMLYCVRAMHGNASAGATASSLATCKIGIYINLYANGLGLPRKVIDQPGMSDEVSDQSIKFVVGPFVGLL